MAILSNINGKFAVDSTGAIQFSGSAGTSGYILRSNGNAAPTWVDSSTVIGGPYLPLTGGTLSGALAGTSATFSGTITTPQINLNSAGGGIIDNQTGNIFIQTPSGTGWIFRNGPSGYDEKMRITSGGDVYIGNSSVTLANTAIFLQKNGIITSVVGSSSTDLIQFYQQNVGGIGTIRRNASGISINGIGQTNQLVVADSGNVGIGTAFPSTTEPTGGNLPTGWTRANSKALEIAAPDFANSGLFLRNSGTTATGTDITGDQYYGDTYIDNRFNNDNGSIYFRTKTAVSPQIRMAIKGSGNVGIGTTVPNYKLSVANASTRIISATYIDGTNGIMSHAGAPNYGLESFQVRGDFISFWTDYDASHYQGTEKMRIDQSGNVLIGTTNNAGTLNVGGKIFAAQNNSNTAAMRITRTVSIPHGSNAGNFTFDFDPVAIWGFSVTGGHVEINVAGWSQRLNAGFIQFQNNGGGAPLTIAIFVQTAVNGNGTISVQVPNPGVSNTIRITFANWHSNAHAWNAWISSPKS